MTTVSSSAKPASTEKIRHSPANCAAGVPFCGLGDMRCLAASYAACSGMQLLESRLPNAISTRRRETANS